MSHGLPDHRTWLFGKEALQSIIGCSGPPNWRTGTHLPSNLPQVSQSSPLVQIDAAVFRRLPFQVAIRGIGFVRRAFWANAGFVASARTGHSRSHKPESMWSLRCRLLCWPRFAKVCCFEGCRLCAPNIFGVNATFQASIVGLQASIAPKQPECCVDRTRHGCIQTSYQPSTRG